MTKQIDDSIMSLPSLIAYIDALLCSLNLESTTQTVVDTAINKDKNTELLWVVQNDTEALKIRAQLAHNNNSKIAESDLFTLASLSTKRMPQRYQLACFWLPALTDELLHQYIPIIMRYRDLYAAHLLIAIDDSIDLNAYGLSVFETTDDTENHQSIALWQFNLYDYKKLPNWLNNDYWANPENWEKNRW